MSCDMRDWQLGDWNWKLCEKWKRERWPKENGKHDVGGEKELEYDSKIEMTWRDAMLERKIPSRKRMKYFPLEHINWKCHIFYLHLVLSLEVRGLW